MGGPGFVLFIAVFASSFTNNKVECGVPVRRQPMMSFHAKSLVISFAAMGRKGLLIYKIDEKMKDNS